MFLGRRQDLNKKKIGEKRRKGEEIRTTFTIKTNPNKIPPQLYLGP